MYTFNQEMLALLLFKAAKLTIISVVGLIGITLLDRMVARALAQRSTLHIRTLASKLIWYSGIILLGITLLTELGFQLSALLGAAGIAGVAIGFASQTSMSNAISGIFLLSENFLAIGDTINCGSVQGIVQSIDLFSVKVRTSDGKLTRIPNERLIKDTLVNETYYPLRRLEIIMAIPGDVPLDNITNIINEVVTQNQHIAREPKHAVVAHSLSSDASHIVIQVWVEHKFVSAVKNNLISEIKQQCDAHDIKALYIMSK